VRRDDLTIEQGTTWAFSWPITVDGASVDLADWSARAQIRRAVQSPTVLYEWSTAKGNATLTNSSVTLSLAPEETSAWTWIDAVYDIEVTDPLGRVARIAGGRVVISREVTRDN
jgi:hypothetical protein